MSKHNYIKLCASFCRVMCLFWICNSTIGQSLAEQNSIPELVNVFLGTSGDHGQLSPGASYPFSYTSIVPQTTPHIHTGYEYAAKIFTGFAHTCFEGVGCMGSGGDLLITPFLGSSPGISVLKKKHQSASVGQYNVSFTNGINVALAVYKKMGREIYQFPSGEKGIQLDFSHTLANGFVAESHVVDTVANTVRGWIDARTTCGVGIFRLYYYLALDQQVQWIDFGRHKLLAKLRNKEGVVLKISLGLSSISEAYAMQTVANNKSINIVKKTISDWSKMLGRFTTIGSIDRRRLFYSLLYRAIQSPYVISETDGTYKGSDGQVYVSDTVMYNGWSVWDNYKTQLPLLSLFYPDKYQGIIQSLSNLYRFGKTDFATTHEPSNTVRTEHTIVVLLDAYRKGYHVDFRSIFIPMQKEIDSLFFATPDKALEFSYDTWAFAEICKILGENKLAQKYYTKAAEYKNYWNKDFKDITKSDVDRMQARGLYQGTIWQYRWFVPFDIKGLKDLDGGDSLFTSHLNYFFKNDLYNHANEPDIQVPSLFNATSEPWRAQELMHRYAVDTVVQYYFNDNSRGIDPFVDRIYKDAPQAYIRTMDDDGGANSSWFILASCGIYPACVGYPVYYLSVPLLPELNISFPNGKKLSICVENFRDENIYIQKVTLNGRILDRNYVTHQELTKGGILKIYTGPQPNKQWGVNNQWISSLQ